MVNMKDIAVYYDKISAFDMLVDFAKVAGVESIQAALDEIAAQQSVHPTYGELPASDVWTTPENLPAPVVRLVPPTSG